MCVNLHVSIDLESNLYSKQTLYLNKFLTAQREEKIYFIHVNVYCHNFITMFDMIIVILKLE